MHNSSLPPTDRAEAPVTFPCDEAVRGRLLSLRDAPGSEWSNRRLASELGWSDAVISQYLSKDGNLYSGDTKKFERKAAEFLRDRWLTLDSEVPTIDCEVARQINDAVEDIRTAKRIGSIVGDPGIGKTRGISLYCASHERSIAFVVRSWYRNQRCVEDCLFEATGGLRDGGTAALANRSRGSSRPVLIDDAHKMASAALQFLYDFRDDTGCPIALFGDERLVAKARSDKQRLRRTGTVYHLRIKDPTPLLTHHVRLLAPGCNGEEKELTALLRKIADRAGHFGSVQMELSLATRIKRGNAELTWCEAVKRAHTRLIRDYALEGKV